jgi:hypothetical protein
MRARCSEAWCYLDALDVRMWMFLAFLVLMGLMAFRVIAIAAGSRDPCGCIGGPGLPSTQIDAVRMTAPPVTPA